MHSIRIVSLYGRRLNKPLFLVSIIVSFLPKSLASIVSGKMLWSDLLLPYNKLLSNQCFNGREHGFEVPSDGLYDSVCFFPLSLAPNEQNFVGFGISLA